MFVRPRGVGGRQGPVDGVELFRAWLRGCPFSRHQHDVYAIGVTEEGVQAFGYRGTVDTLVFQLTESSTRCRSTPRRRASSAA